MRRPLVRATGLAVIALMAIAATALAFSSSNAVSYANQWWNSRNPAYNSYDNDCANYVSQVMFAGGYPMNASTNNPWYANYGYQNAYSQSWRFVRYNRGFFLTDGGTVKRTYYGVKTAYPSGISLADIVYYSWYGDRTFASDAHEAVVTLLNGKATSSPETGVLVNAHSNNRYREFWTLYKFNTHWPTTYYEIVHTRRP